MKVITGRPHRLLPEVIRRIGECAEKGEPCMLLVPSQATLQAELEIMERLNLRGSFMIDVLSPTRLQGRVFERAGAPEQTIFDERGKCMVLSAIVEEEKENLRVYGNAAQNSASGFVAKISALISDFKRSGQSAADILLGAEQLGEQDTAGEKLRDAARIYAAYEQRMAGELADAEDVAQAMRARLVRSGVLDGQRVFVYGFDMITPTFAADLLAMDACAVSVTLAVESDDNSAPDGQLFAPVNYSLERLSKMARESGRAIEREKVCSQLDAPWDMQTMEAGLFAIGVKPCENLPEHIELTAASGIRQEVHLAAARMRRLAAEGKDLTQMAAVYPKGSGYAALLANILPMYGITPYIAEKRAAAQHPLARFLLSALNVVSGNWRTADVLECVQSGMMGLSGEACDALCNYCEGADIRGEGMKRPFLYDKGQTEETLQQLNESREQIVRPLLMFQKEMNAAQTADDTIAAVLHLLDAVDAFETLADMRKTLDEADLHAEAEDCAQVWNALMETLDQLHVLLGGQAVAARVILSLLQNGLSALELSALPPADGAVICGSIGNVRKEQVDTLFVLGMNDMQAGGDPSLLTPSEKAAATEKTGVYLGMDAQESAALAQLDELKALSGARDRLLISYALADETGRALREGAAVQALRRLFPSMPVRGGLVREEREAMLAAREPALEAIGVALSDASDGREEPNARIGAAYAALDRTAAGSDALASVTRCLSRPIEPQLDSAMAHTLYGRPVISVSRLEAFAQCPYRHFVRYGLSPQTELEPGVDRAEVGTLYHEAAEQFTRAVTALPEFPQIAPEVCDRLMDEAVAPLLDKWRASPLGESARGAAIAKRIAKTARRTGRNIVSQYAASDFKPFCTEFVFGQNGLAPIMLELADGTFVYLQGRIDRVDVLDRDGRLIRIVDYKSGGKKFDPTMVYWGLQLQLLLYLAAALAQIPGAKAAGFFYCRIADPMVKAESRIQAEVEKQIAKKLSLAGISLSDVSVLRAHGAEHAAMITKDEKPSARSASSMVDETGMEALVNFARNKASALAGEAYGGVIADWPAECGTFIACNTCDYAAVCGFDPTRKKRKHLSKKEIADLL